VDGAVGGDGEVDAAAGGEERQSMNRTGSCYNNAACENLWAVLKAEIGTRIRPDRTAARAQVFEFIEVSYNRKRRGLLQPQAATPTPRVRLPHPSGDTRAAPGRAHVGSVRRKCPAQRGNFTEDIAAILDALGISRAVLVAHSMGTLVARTLAAHHPSNVAGLTLLGAIRPPDARRS
jgi:hypothetical protein